VSARHKHGYGWVWATAAFFGIGYLVTTLGLPAAARTTATAPATRPRSQPAGVAAPAPGRSGGPPEIRSPVYATAILVALTIPFGARARGLLRGAGRGIGLGLAGGAGIWAGLGKLARLLPAEIVTNAAALAALTALICCGSAGAVFGALAERRRKLAEGPG